LWDTAKGKAVWTSPEYSDGVYRAAFSKSGSFLVVSGSYGIRVWDANTRKQLWKISTQGYPVTGLAVSPDGAFVVASYGGLK
jgi:WD40 repeat protein